MRRLFVCVAVLSFLANAPASAENNNHRGDRQDAATSDAGRNSSGIRVNDRENGSMRRNVNGDTHPRANGGAQNTIGAVAPPGHTHSVGPHRTEPAVGMSSNQYLPASGDVHPNSVGPSTADRARNNSGWTGNKTAHNNDRKALRRNMQASRRFHGGDYIAPRGYQSRHWSYGERLPRLYYARDYWIGDYVMFGLFTPPSDLAWVRVGDDALLIDRDTGEIVQVHYGFFY